ncbi:MAG TPA: RidA family protein [Tepidisphaeraceae bacterium]|nr:RidA family protein [Tepidisphaeraceae bacterium]
MPLSEKLTAMNITLPTLAGPFGAYVPAKRVGNLLYVSGQLPMKDGQLIATGTVPSVTSIESATAAARQCVINGLAAAATVLESVDQIVGVVRVGAFVASDAGFSAQPTVANGASTFLIDLLGDAGRHVRAAVGVNVLPLNASVEVEFIFEVI